MIFQPTSSRSVPLAFLSYSLTCCVQSFIGGLYTEQGLEACATWLNPLFRPYAKAAYDAVRLEHGLPPVCTDTPTWNGNPPPSSPAPSSNSSGDGNINIGHLALFNQRLQKGDSRVEWVYSDQHPFGPNEAGALADNDRFAHGNKSTPVWSVQVLVDGEVYGRGRGNTKKAARNEAAKQGLVRMGVAVW